MKNNKKIALFGEIMIRLKPRGKERFFQTPFFEATFAGSESNVAILLSNLGEEVNFVTALPDNEIGYSVRQFLRSFNVNCEFINFTTDRMGLFFLEEGASLRPSKVIYDRKNSCIARTIFDRYNWENVFDNVDWFHISGISFALSEIAAETSLYAVKFAKGLGIKVSCDLNYRKNLWDYGKSAYEVMTEVMKYVDVLIGNEEDIQQVLKIVLSDDEKGGLDTFKQYDVLTKKVINIYPNISTVAITIRESISADRNLWAGVVQDANGGYFVSNKYDLNNIVDRVGAGDSFAGAIIYALKTIKNLQETIDFAVACSAIKHTIPNDINRCSIKEIQTLLKGNISGRIER